MKSVLNLFRESSFSIPESCLALIFLSLLILVMFPLLWAMFLLFSFVSICVMLISAYDITMRKLYK